MKRKAMAITLTAAMLAGLTAVPTWAEDAAADEGKVLNIYCWNEEFKSRLTDHYPDMKKLTELMARSEMLMLYGTLLLLMTMHIRIIWMRLF